MLQWSFQFIILLDMANIKYQLPDPAAHEHTVILYKCRLRTAGSLDLHATVKWFQSKQLSHWL